MVLLQRLLLLPLLAPLLVVLLVGALNPRPSLALRLLTWTSPALPIGAWIALAAGAGAGLSAAGTALALGMGQAASHRQVRRPANTATDTWGQDGREPWVGPEESPPPRRQPSPAATGPVAAPQRPPGDPAPTVAVPFRVIRKGRGPVATEPAAPATPAAETVGAQASAGGDGWDSPGNDDW